MSEPLQESDMPSAWDAIAAAAIMVGTLLDAHPDKREWLEGAVAKQAGSFPGAVHLQYASEVILREVDQPKSAIGERPHDR